MPHPVATDCLVRYSDVALAAIALCAPEQSAGFVVRELGQLAGDDDECRRLAFTLRVYLEEGSSLDRAARRLGVHKNTVLNRVKRAHEVWVARWTTVLSNCTSRLPSPRICAEKSPDPPGVPRAHGPIHRLVPEHGVERHTRPYDRGVPSSGRSDGLVGTLDRAVRPSGPAGAVYDALNEALGSGDPIVARLSYARSTVSFFVEGQDDGVTLLLDRRPPELADARESGRHRDRAHSHSGRALCRRPPADAGGGRDQLGVLLRPRAQVPGGRPHPASPARRLRRAVDRRQRSSDRRPRRGHRRASRPSTSTRPSAARRSSRARA